MTEREQNEIIGKTVREHRDATEHLAALNAKGRTYAAAMRSVAQQLYPQRIIHTRESIKDIAGKADYPGIDEVAELLEEIAFTTERIAELSRLLFQMGVKPQ